jgi:hypothetical protein
LAYDNLSSIPLWMSDAFCRLATGAGLVGRTLFTNAEETAFYAKRPVVLTGINSLALRSDLSDRAVKIFLAIIEESGRQDEATFWRNFEAERPRIFGAILNALALGLKNLPTTKIKNLPRMADYAIWGAACEGAYAPKDAFIAAMRKAKADATHQVLENSVPAQVLRSHMHKFQISELDTTVGALFATLDATAKELALHKSREWPGDGRKLMRDLNLVSAQLREVGYEIKRPKQHSREGLVRVVITYNDPETSPVSPASPVANDFNHLDDGDTEGDKSGASPDISGGTASPDISGAISFTNPLENKAPEIPEVPEIIPDREGEGGGLTTPRAAHFGGANGARGGSATNRGHVPLRLRRRA